MFSHPSGGRPHAASQHQPGLRPDYRAKPGHWQAKLHVRHDRSLPESHNPACGDRETAGNVRPVAATLPRFLPVGDIGLSIEFGSEIDVATNDAVAALDQAIAAAEIAGVVETVPSFRSLLVIFEPALVPSTQLLQQLRSLIQGLDGARPASGRRWRIPVAYELPFGDDLNEVSTLLGLSPREIVAEHTAAEFRVFMLGFQPGMPNLGGLPPRLHISRRAAPRAPVQGGSIIIGGVQGAIVPMPTPTGFYVLGRTPIRPFNRRRPEPALFRPGDTLRFHEVCADEFACLDAAAAEGRLDLETLLEPENASR